MDDNEETVEGANTATGPAFGALTAEQIAKAINKELDGLGISATVTKHSINISADALLKAQSGHMKHLQQAFTSTDFSSAPTLVNGGTVTFDPDRGDLYDTQQVKAKTARKLRRMGCSTKPIRAPRSERGTRRRRFNVSRGDMLLLEVVSKTAIAIQKPSRVKRGPRTDLSWAYDAMKGHLKVADAVLRMGGTDALKSWMVEHLTEAMPRGRG